MPSQILTRADASPWPTPTGAINLKVECFGPGGAGGTSDGIKGGYAGGGGGGGAYSRKTIASPSGSYAFSVGAGGTPSSTTGDTWFASVTTCLAKGGQTGADASAGYGGSSTSGYGDVKYSGGNGYAYVSEGTSGGGGGEGAYASGAGTNATSRLGATGTDGGDGADGGLGSTPGHSASGYGGGGGGGGFSNYDEYYKPGGDGADGQIILTWDVYEPKSFSGSDTFSTPSDSINGRESKAAKSMDARPAFSDSLSLFRDVIYQNIPLTVTASENLNNYTEYLFGRLTIRKGFSDSMTKGDSLTVTTQNIQALTVNLTDSKPIPSDSLKIVYALGLALEDDNPSYGGKLRVIKSAYRGDCIPYVPQNEWYYETTITPPIPEEMDDILSECPAGGDIPPDPRPTGGSTGLVQSGMYTSGVDEFTPNFANYLLVRPESDGMVIGDGMSWIEYGYTEMADAISINLGT